MAFTQALSIGSEVSCTTRLGKNVEGKVIALDEDRHVIVVRILLSNYVLINAHLYHYKGSYPLAYFTWSAILLCNS